MTAQGQLPIAIIGMGCRFPGNATDPQKLWALLAEGRSCWTDVPTDRFNESAFYHPNPDAPGAHNHRGGHFLAQDIAAFDADFFGISSAEAQAMDPQQRILLETTYEALESCGASLDRIRGSNTAVYIAMFSRDYDRNLYKDTDDIPKYHTTGTGEAILASRISYIFDLKGPSMTLDTGCSGSLVALHQACQSLRAREVDMAIVGGVNLIIGPDQMTGMSNVHMLNGDGRSYSFDSRGSGYGRGEGSAAVVVKRLDDAIHCCDPIRAVICHTAVNQDGKTSGITLPSQDAQKALQQSIYQKASIDPRSIGYVEAHGTGTTTGDLAEVGAIRDTFCNGREIPLHLGSIKSNIGHLESASGLAGLVKAVLILEKGRIPANANFEVERAGLNLAKHNIFVPKKLETFGDYPIRRVSVNSFGYGGTNAHAILEEAPRVNRCSTPKSDARLNERRSSLLVEQVPPHLYVLSARTKKSLILAVQNFNQWASRHEDGLDIDDLAYTLSMRRTMLDWRFAFVANQYKDIIGATQDVNANGSLQQISLEFRVAFLFTGQGAQWYAMGRELLMTYSRFRESIFTSASVLQELGASWYLVDELLLEEPETRINQSWLAQPACTAIQIALVDLLESIGVQPGVVLGHSSGEIAAAYTAGMLTQAAALRVAYHRGFVSGHRNTPMPQKGAMLAVGLSEDEALGHIRDVGCDDVCIACVNSPTSTTVSGNEASVLRLHDKLQSLSIFSRKLNVDTAYHSYHMQEASTTYLGRLNGLEVKSPLKSRRFISTVTALERISGFGPRYWVENLVSKVRYSDAILRHCHLEQGVDRPLRGRAKQIMIEIGPHATLAGPKRQTIQQKKGTFEYDYLPTLIRGTNALAAFLDLTGKLFERGYPLDLEMVNSMTLTKPHPVVTHNLPTYPWDHSHRHWYESRLSKQHRFRPHASHDLLGTRITSSTTLEPHWRHLIGIDILPWLQEHQVDDLVIFPAAAYICMVIEAARQLFVNSVCPRHYEIVLKTVSFSRALVVPPAPAKVELQLSLVRPMNFIGSDTSVHHEFRISALSSKEVWHEHCSGLVTVHHLELPADSLTSSTASELGHSCGELVSMIHADRTINVNLHDLYRDLKANGNYYGPCFAAIKRADIDNEVEMVTTVEIPDVAKVMPREYQRPHLIHPTTLDALMHSTVPLYISKKGPGSVMPTAIREFRISTMIDNAPGRHLRAETTLTPDGLVTANADVIVSESDRSNMPILRIFGVELRGFGRNPNNVSTHAQPHDNSFLMRWDVDPDFLSPSHLASLETVDTTTSPVTKTALLNRIASIYIKRSLAEPKTIGERSSEPHLLRLNDWMERHSLLSTKERLEDENEELSDVDLLLQVRQYGVEGRMLSRIGQNLTSILTGKIEPLGLMLEDDLLYHFYADESTNRCYGYLSRYLRYLGFKNPRMRILEIGAGTGSTTIPVLTTLNAEGASRMDHYHFTDISAGFFDKARVLLAEWRASVIFKRLDISHDPVSQGFGLHHYDLVIASNVLHATSSIEKTLSNVRRLLKPQGKLALIELTQPQSFLGLIFGTLHGWWQGVHDGREDSPILTQHQWHSALSNASFGGIDLAVDDSYGPSQTSTFMLSSATTLDLHIMQFQVKIIIDQDRSDACHRLADVTKSELESRGLEVSFIAWESNLLIADTIYVIIDDSKRPLLVDLTPSRFDQIIRLMAYGRNVLWISGHESAGLSTSAETGLVTGLARTAHAENHNLRLVTLNIQQGLDLQDKPKLLSTISDIIFCSFHPSSDKTFLREREYTYKDNSLLIPRILPHRNLSQWSSRGLDPSIASEVYGQAKRPLKLASNTTSSPEKLIFGNDDRMLEQLDDYHVEIEVKAHGVNNADVAFALGHAEAHSVMGECAGIVVATGPMVSNISQGHRVVAFGATPYASRVRVSERNTARIPDSMHFNVGASIPLSFMNAFYCLIRLANIKRCQSVMIFSATGPIGQASILIAQQIGSKPLPVVNSIPERDLLIEKFGLPPSNILLARTESIRKRIFSLTDGSGVDLVLSCGSHELSEDELACASFGGSLIQVIEPGLDPSQRLVAAIPPDKNLTFRIVDLIGLIRREPLEVSLILPQLMRLFESGVIQANHSITVEPISQIEKVFKALEVGSAASKHVLESGEGLMVKTVGLEHHQIALDEAAIYVVAGGLGDVGSILLELMVRRGAKHLVVLSRREFEADEHLRIESKLRMISPEAKLHWRTCDIADGLQVTKCAASLLSRGLPPVKGVIQAAIVLHDRTMSNMTLEDFNVPLKSKLHGTRNLYAAFEHLPLNFFIILSSISGVIGVGGQASYAAGNTFQDAFAMSAQSEEFPCLSLDIGLIENAKYNNSARENNLKRHGLIPMKSQDLLDLLEYAMSSQIAPDQCKQIIVGFDWRSISQVQITNATTKSPLFCHIQRPFEDEAPSTSLPIEKTLRTAVSESLDTAAVQQTVKAAISRKISSIVASDDLNQRTNSSMTELGLDSLMTTELRNWISTEFQAATQVSEILDEASIESLASLVASRSPFVSEKTRAMSGEQDEAKVKSNESFGGGSEVATEERTPSPSTELPILPLPRLENTLDMYLESRRVFLSEDESSKTSLVIAEFLKDGGFGQKLQNRLNKRYQDPNIEDWLREPYTNKIYLERRDPIHPTGTFYGGHLLGDVRHTQAERAAILAVAAFEFKSVVDDGILERDFMNGEPLCIDLLQWLFNTVREPKIGRDIIRRSLACDYMIVLRHGHVAKISLKIGPNKVSYWRLKAALEHFLAETNDQRLSVATLTADERNSWAEVREYVVSIDEINSQTMSTIESAAFVICLDDAEPSNASERCNQFFLGDPSNRWSDKNLQFVVCKNGVSAFIGEHAMLDGMSVRQFNVSMTRAILEHKAADDESTCSQSGEDLVQDLSFVIDATMESRADHIQKQFHSKYAPIEFVHHRIRSLGNTFLRLHKCPAKAGYQVIIQLACLLYYGYQPESWETISMAHYHKGRVDWIQAVQPAMASFCAAARDNTLPLYEQRKLFFEAVSTFANTMTKISRGHGFKAHLHALLAMVQDDEPVPAFFTDQAWLDTTVSSVKTVKTDCLEGLMLQETAFLMAEPKCIFVHYEVKDDECMFFVQAWPGRTRAICKALEKAAESVKTILEASE